MTRCGELTDKGRPCRRQAGAGTDHPGEGPCDRHEHRTLADNPAARQAFIDAVAADPALGIRAAVEPLGYKRRDVRELLNSDPDFAEAYAEARGRDLDRVEQTLWQVAQNPEHPSWQRANRFLLEARGDPAFRDVKYHRVDGDIRVQGVPMIDASKLTDRELEQLVVLLKKASPSAEELPKDGRPALELVAGDRVP